MTDEELDVARANEAIALTGKNGWTLPVAIIAARLTREGWTPTDPDLLEARRIVKETLSPESHKRCNCREEIDGGEWDAGHKIRASLAAIRRGRQLAQEQQP